MFKNLKKKIKLLLILIVLIAVTIIGIVEYKKITNINKIAHKESAEEVLKEQRIWTSESDKISFEVTEEKVTTNKITVDVKNVQIQYESEQDLQYKYYIKKSNEVDYKKEASHTGTEKSYTFDNLEAGLNYDVKIEVANSKTEEKIEGQIKEVNTKELPNAKEELEKGNILVTEPTWNNNTATVQLITTIEGITIEYQVNTGTEGSWTEGNTVSNLKNGDILRIRLTDGSNKGKVGSITIGKTEEVSIVKQETTSNSITVQVESKNKEYTNETGTEYSYYIKKANETNYPSTPTYTGESNYTFNNLSKATEYDVKVVLTNKAGNKIETVSEITTETGKIVVADYVGKPASDENIYTEDDYGNKVVIPANFIVLGNNDSYVVYDYDNKNGTTNRPEVQDGIVIQDPEGNEFVWVPVGEIKNNREGTSTTTLKLGRYENFTMDTSTAIPTPPEPKQEASKTSYDETTAEHLIRNSPNQYFENTTGSYNGITYKGAKFETLGKWINNTIDNGGYYIARYEASYGTDGKANSKPSTGIPLDSTTNSSATKTEGQLWNWINQEQASTASKSMYQTTENLGYYSQLINSYAWDTSIIFIQAYEDQDYSNQQTMYEDNDRTILNPANTGERGSNANIGQNTTDKVCNIYDIASNIREWTTETFTNEDMPTVDRGGTFYGSYTSSFRGLFGVANKEHCIIGFRPILDCYVEGYEETAIEGDITGNYTWNNEEATVTLNTTTQYTIEYKIGENGNWTIGTTVTGLHHGDVIYARLTDGENSGDVISFNIQDGIAPQNATISLSATSAEVGEQITATVTHKDNESGVNITSSKYIYNQTATNIGITSSLWDSATAFNSNPQTINIEISTEETYYLHVLTVDKAGNKTETISDAVTVENTKQTVADLIGETAANENIYTQDEYGNKIVVPADFIVLAHGESNVIYDYDKQSGVSTNIPVVQDGIVIQDAEGNEFVWVPVGKIKNNREGTNITNLKLGRYMDFTMGVNNTPPDPKQEASKTEYDNTTEADIIDIYYPVFENSTGTYNGIQYKSTGNFKTLGEWISNTIDNGGYYIARYEASYGTDGKANSKPSTGTPLNSTASPSTAKTEGQLWNVITQQDASTASKAMYPNGEGVNYYSELANGYAWDTAIIFIQSYSNNPTYAIKKSTYTDTSSPYQPANTGERGATVGIGTNSTDKECNIYDMADNTSEWTTETNSNPNTFGPRINRGGNFRYYSCSTSDRLCNSNVHYAENVSFRSVLDCKSQESEKVIITGEINITDPIWNNETATLTLNTTTQYAIEYKIGENGNWITGTTVTGLHHGDVIYARLTDGENSGETFSFNILDGIDPQNAEIVLSSVQAKVGEQITATVTHKDNESGVDIPKCKYIYNQISTNLGINSNEWENAVTANNNPQTINLATEQEGTYYLHVLTVDKAGKKTEIVSNPITVLKKIEGDITVSNINWNNGKATITLNTPTSYTIQYKKGTNGTWTTGTTITDLSHGDVVYARLIEGNNIGEEIVSINIQDSINPQNSNISLNTTLTQVGKTVTATVTHRDDQSGVNITGCKYIFNQTATQLGTTSSLWDSATAFNSNPQTINLTAPSQGTYYLHVLTTDNAGKKIETVSNAVTVKATVANLIGITVQNNTYTEDKYGNKIVVPSGFKVLGNGTQYVTYDYDKENGNPTREPVVQDGIVIQDGEGNEFVWVPVGTIKNNTAGTSTTTIKLGRYTDANNGFTMNTTTYPRIPPNPSQEASKTVYDTIVEIGSAYFTTSNYKFFENTTGTYNGTTYGGTKFATLGQWISNTIDNGGYYIARYEASYGSDGKPNSKPSTGTPLNSSTGSYTSNTYVEGQLWNWINQTEASNASKAMYQASQGLGYYSELMNSYAWDTAIIFIQTYDENNAFYASQATRNAISSTGGTYQPGNTGHRDGNAAYYPNTTDMVCNIYDMASNLNEWTTETARNSNSPCVYRGGHFVNPGDYTAARNYSSAIIKGYYCTFRPILDCYTGN